jgi:uncharacterized membrane protein YhaH (DUF805 family)
MKEKTAEPVNLSGALANFFSNYANFRGQSSRSEYFYAFGFFFTIGLLLALIVPIWPSVEIQFLFLTLTTVISIAVVLPFAALSVRRLRDAGFPPFLGLLLLVPLGGLVLLILAFSRSKPVGFSQSVSASQKLSDIESELGQLEDLHRRGLIDDNQLREAKNKVLGI